MKNILFFSQSNKILFNILVNAMLFNLRLVFEVHLVLLEDTQYHCMLAKFLVPLVSHSSFVKLKKDGDKNDDNTC